MNAGIVQCQNALAAGVAFQQQMFQERDKGLTVLAVGHLPANSVLPIQISAEQMEPLLRPRRGDPFLPAPPHPTSPQRGVQAQERLVHKDKPDFRVGLRTFFSRRSVLRPGGEPLDPANWSNHAWVGDRQSSAVS